MKIKEIEIENFRGFKNLKCDFLPGINVIVGTNGSGKTSLLDAISVGYGQFFSALNTGVDRGVNENEIHLEKININKDEEIIQMEPQFPVKITCSAYKSNINNDDLKWSRSRNTKKGRTTQVKEIKKIAKYLQKKVQENEVIDLPVFGYYGTGRLFDKSRISSFKKDSLIKMSRLEGYRGCMDPDSGYSSFAIWFKNETQANLERKLKIIESLGFTDEVIKGVTIRDKLLQAITNSVNDLIKPSGWEDIRYSSGQKQIVATHKDLGTMPISGLSDGVRNMIGVIADIAYRCVRLNPHLEENSAKKTHGLVLIDEIDMHLHPSWQQLVLQNLSEAFPNIQFIVTTHSPQVLTTVSKEQIKLLTGENQVSSPSTTTLGEQSNYVMSQIFGVNSRPPMDFSEKLKEYLILVEKNKWQTEEAISLRSYLVERMGENHTDLMHADRVIKRKEYIAK